MRQQSARSSGFGVLAVGGEPQSFFDLQAEFLDHRLRDRIDCLDGGQDGLASFAQGEQQAAFHGMQPQLAFESIGLSAMPRVSQPLDEVTGLLFWNMCHGHTVAAPSGEGIDLDQPAATRDKSMRGHPAVQRSRT